MTKRAAALFVSHGSPMFAVQPGEAGKALRELGKAMPKPDAVLLLSPHWFTHDLRVTSAPNPGMIHDFGGFPDQLYRLRYTPPGNPELAATIVARLRETGLTALADPDRSLDHGAWVPLMHLFPDADVPVIQISMPRSMDPASAFALGRALRSLRDDNVMVIGSGSITHNLHDLSPETDASYVMPFVAWIRDRLAEQDVEAIIDYRNQNMASARAHPTEDHYLPLPFAMGACFDEDRLSVIKGQITDNVIAMDPYAWS